MPCVYNATSPGSWHLESQTLTILGGRANIECISSMQRPAGADRGVIVDEAFSTDWHDWSYVYVIRAVHLLAGRFSGIAV